MSIQEGWLCPRCNKVNSPTVMTCPCSFKHAEEYPRYPATPNSTMAFCYICGQQLTNHPHYCPGPSTTATGTTTITGTNICNICNTMYPINGYHSCGGSISK